MTGIRPEKFLDSSDGEFPKVLVAADPVDGEKCCECGGEDEADHDIAGGNFIAVVGPQKIDKKRGEKGN